MENCSYVISPSLTFFITSNGEFILRGKEEYNLKVKDYSLYLLPLLERERDSFWSVFIKCDQANLDDLKRIINDVIKFPFDNKMEYWSEKAVSWIDQNDLSSYLWLYVIDDDWMTQKLKHTIYKLRSKMRMSR
ncbi:hypothetical protein ACTHGU_03645 [Chitinophagaceae bacterium MMS25-I14]